MIDHLKQKKFVRNILKYLMKRILIYQQVKEVVTIKIVIHS